MTISKRLQIAGFEKIGNKTFALSSGEVIHVVTIHKDKHGKSGISLCAWHPQFVDQETEFDLRSIRSPVFGYIGPEGVIPSWTWTNVDSNSDHISYIAEAYASCFRTLDDFRHVFEGFHSVPFFSDAMSAGAIRKSSVVARVFGAYKGKECNPLTQGEALTRCDDFAAGLLGEHGFKKVDSEGSLTFIKERGEIVDCIRFSLDQFSVFAEIQVFPWARDIWRVEKRLKGVYHPIVSRRTEDVEAMWVRPVSSLFESSIDDAFVWIKNRLDGQQDIRSVDKFAETIDPMFVDIRMRLVRLKA